MSTNVLCLENLTVTVAGDSQEKALVKDVSFYVPELCISALVGGSGSGKTTTGLSILRLLPLGLNIREGRILFRGEELLRASGERMRQLRGKDISMVFQDPLDAFNPVFTIGDQIDEVLRFHVSLSRRQRRERVMELLDLAGLPEPRRVARTYPHQLSGGMRQRAMIAQAIAAGPKLMIADEPTSSLDVTLQARIMDLFRKLKDELKLSVLLITHDLGMVAHIADEVAVMREGRIVEQGKTQDVLRNPRHPYTRQLMDALKV
jgi:ABC-type dipeptide/oligopeptide/nickel transport system ATPase component